MMFTTDHAIKDNRFICDVIPVYLDIADKVHNDRLFMKVYLAKAKASVISLQELVEYCSSDYVNYLHRVSFTDNRVYELGTLDKDRFYKIIGFYQLYGAL